METIVLIIERSDPFTGKRYCVEKRFDGKALRRCRRSVGEQMEDAIEDMHQQLYAEKEEVRTHKPKLP